MGAKVLQFAKPLTVANAFGSARVSSHSQSRPYSQVLEQGLVAYPLASATNDASELGLARAQGTLDCVEDQCLMQ